MVLKLEIALSEINRDEKGLQMLGDMILLAWYIQLSETFRKHSLAPISYCYSNSHP